MHAKSINSYLRRENYFRKKVIQVNEIILLEIIKELKSRNLDYVFLVFHPGWIHGVGAISENVIDWRETFLRQVFRWK